MRWQCSSCPAEKGVPFKRVWAARPQSATNNQGCSCLFRHESDVLTFGSHIERDLTTLRTPPQPHGPFNHNALLTRQPAHLAHGRHKDHAVPLADFGAAHVDGHRTTHALSIQKAWLACKLWPSCTYGEIEVFQHSVQKRRRTVLLDKSKLSC